MTFALVNSICWGIFGLVWISGAIYNYYKAPTVKQRRSDWFIIIVAWLIMHFIPSHFFTFMRFHVLWLQSIGAVLLIYPHCLLYGLDGYWEKMWASTAVIKTDHQLVTDGPYQITRNPIYTGVLGMILGSAISFGQGAIFLSFIVLLFLFLNRIRLEEQLMTQTFGEQYLLYKNRVPQLVPGLKSKS